MFLIKVLTFNPVQENTYILYNENKDCIVIDPGCYSDEEKEALKSFIDKNELQPKLLINTHCHLDHVFGNKYIAEAYQLTLQIHKNEEAVLQMAPASGLMFNLPFDNYKGELIFLKEGDIVSLGEDSLQVIEAPGHSPGSICFYCEKQKFIIGGDVLFYQSIGRTDLPGGSHEGLIKNIKEKLFVLPQEVKVYPGHGPATTIGDEIKYNPYLI
ncbi:MBL fold metallo-hydrolase [Ginsengibacter hankyongi]|uniref:MBL fold metallo-hydrolase n=1 Tax=Ginsengibacter hankyongi TaxID=2607284 RepID=A0A5J5IP06_9BACT|nr:MBL fold metallo-hydrolase [Ginsengibacter hankyongi]KAA9041737.1 MBL fold metallo-hydrolase [Ginsengibacter hankyongi]